MTLAVLCPGQGAQHARMLEALLRHDAARSVFDVAAQALGDDPRMWLENERDLFANAVAQPLICTTALATWTVLAQRLPRPIAFAGYSVGELACYGLAGAVDAADLARLARDRAAVMDIASAGDPGGLVAIRGLARKSIERICSEVQAFVAIANGEDAFVVGGTLASLTELERRAQREGAQVTSLRVGIASHTPLLAAAITPFRARLSATRWRAPAAPIVAGIDARLVRDEADAVETLSKQLANTIEWAQCLDVLYERGCRVFLEMPPGHALSRMARERHGDVEARGVDEFRELDAIVRWVERNRG